MSRLQDNFNSLGNLDQYLDYLNKEQKSVPRRFLEGAGDLLRGAGSEIVNAPGTAAIDTVHGVGTGALNTTGLMYSGATGKPNPFAGEAPLEPDSSMKQIGQGVGSFIPLIAAARFGQGLGTRFGFGAGRGAVAGGVGGGGFTGLGDLNSRVENPTMGQQGAALLLGGTQGLFPSWLLAGKGGGFLQNMFGGALTEAIQEPLYTAGMDLTAGTSTSAEDYGKQTAIGAIAGGAGGAFAGRLQPEIPSDTTSERIEPQPPVRLLPRADLQEDYAGGLPATQGSRDIVPHGRPLPNPLDAYIEHIAGQHKPVPEQYRREYADPVRQQRADYEQASPNYPTALSDNGGVMMPKNKGELVPFGRPVPRDNSPPLPSGNSTGAARTGQNTRTPSEGAGGDLPINGRATKDFNVGDGNKSVREATVKMNDLKMNPEVFQHRPKSNAKGSTDRLSGVKNWNQTAAGKFMLFQEANGELTVANGHHRKLKAEELQVKDPSFNPDVEAHVFREADGWTPQEVKRVAAISNIREGNADAVDIAVAFRGLNEKQIAELDLPSGGIAYKQGKDMSKLTEEAFSHVLRGHIKDADGAVIGRMITDPQKQLAAAKAFEKRQPPTESERYRLAGLVAESGATHNQEQANLFGEDGTTSLGERTLDVLRIADNLVRDNKNLAKALLRKAGTIDKNKLGTVDEQESARQRDELTMTQKLLNRALTVGEEAEFMKSLIAKMPENSADISQGDLRRAAEEYIKFLGKESPVQTEGKPIPRFTDSDTVKPEPEKKKVAEGPSDGQRLEYLKTLVKVPLIKAKTVADFDKAVDNVDLVAGEIGLDRNASFLGGLSRQQAKWWVGELFGRMGLNYTELDNAGAFVDALARESFPDAIESGELRTSRLGHTAAGFHSTTLNDKDGKLTSKVVLRDARGQAISNSAVFFHEMGHHLFNNALTHNERMEFFKILRAKSFDSKGQRIDSPYTTKVSNYEEAAVEVFTHEFQRYAYRRFTPKEQQSWDFWKKIVKKYVKPLFDWHASDKRDTDFDEIFKKLLPESPAKTTTEGGKKQTDIFDTPEGRGFGQRQVELDDAVIEAGGKPGSLKETATEPQAEKKKSKPKQKEDPGPIFQAMRIFSDTDNFNTVPMQAAIRRFANGVGLGLSARAIPDAKIPVSSIKNKTVFVNTAKRPDTSVGKNWYSGFQDIVGHLIDSNQSLSKVFNGDRIDAQEWFHDYAVGQGGTEMTAKVMDSLSKKQRYALERFKLTFDEASNFKQVMNYLKNYPAPMRNGVARAGEYIRDAMFDGLAPLRRAIAEKIPLSNLEYEHILSLIKRTPQGGQISRAIMGITGVPRLEDGSFIYEPDNKSLKDIFSKVKSKDLETFSKVVRAHELLASNVKGIDQSEIDAAHRALNGNQHFKETADELFQYFDDLAELAIDAGVIPRETYEKMKHKYPKYAPQFKVSDDVSSSFFQRTGSQSAMERVDIAAQDHTRNVIGKVNKTIAARALVNVLVENGGSEKIAKIEDITKDSREVKEDFGIVRKGGKDGDLYMVVPDENGVKHSYHITDRVMADAVMFMIQGRDIPAVLQWSRGMKKWTQSVISLLPQFQILVAGKEIVSAQLVGKAGGKPFIPPDVKAFTDAVKSNSGWGKSDLPVATMEALINGGITGLNSIEITPRVKLGTGLDTDFMSWLDSFSNAVLGDGPFI